MTDWMMIQVENISKSFGIKLVFKDIKFTVEDGELLMICGPNGSGKTTLLKLLAGFIQPSSGRIFLDCSQNKIGYMGHETFIYPEMSPIENLTFWSKLYNQHKTKEELESILDKVGLFEVQYEQADYFSRGMLQRLSLARLLALAPKLLLLDEPGSGMDAEGQNILKQEIEKAKLEGKTIVMITHFTEQDRQVADKVLFLKNGHGKIFQN